MLRLVRFSHCHKLVRKDYKNILYIIFFTKKFCFRNIFYFKNLSIQNIHFDLLQYLSKVTQGNLRIRIHRAKKFLMLFGEEGLG